MLQGIRTAKSWGKEPLDILIGSHHRLEDRVVEALNIMLMRAYQIVEDETCKSCGVPFWHGKSTDRFIELKIEETTCYSCAELERSREKDKKTEPGVTKYVTAQAYEGAELPSREESYKRMSKHG